MARSWRYTNRSLASATFRVALVLVYSISHSSVLFDGFPARLCILPITLSRLTRDGTAETVLRGQILTGDREIFVSFGQMTTSSIGHRTRFIHTLL